MTTDDVTDFPVPARLRRMWSIDEPTRKGPRPALSRDEIASAAIAIADAEGLAAVSMSRVAQSLGYTTMSLYRYVEGKDELIALMWDSALETPTDIDVSDGWRPALEHWARLQLEGLRAHPWGVDVAINTPPLSPRQIAYMELGLAALADTPLTYGDKIQVILAISVAILAEVRLTRDLAQGEQLSTPDYGALIEHLVDRDTYPHMRAAVDEGVFDYEVEDPDEDFAFTLNLTLDGIETLITARSNSHDHRH